MSRKHLLLILAITPAATGILRADSLFTSISNACNITQSVLQSPSLAQTQATNALCHNGASAQGFAGPGGIGALTQGESDVNNPTGAIAQHIGRVQFTTAFRNEGGTPGTTDVALNLWISSQFSDPLPGGGTIFMAVSVTFGGFSGGSSASSVNPSQGFGLTHFNLGTTNQALTTSMVTVPLNTPILFLYQMEAIAGMAGANGGNEQMLLNALNTLSFPKSGPVFTVAPGIFVDDVPGVNLRNNQFVTPTSAVPEPGTVGLMGLAFAALAFGRRSLRRIR